MDSKNLGPDAFFWALQGLCALHHKPYSDALLRQQFPAPHNCAALREAIQALGFQASFHKLPARKLHRRQLPLVAWLSPLANSSKLSVDAPASDPASVPACELVPAIVLEADGARLLLVEPGDPEPREVQLADFAARFQDWVLQLAPAPTDASDPDCAALAAQRLSRFGFHWFVPELLKYRRYWQEILLASLTLQLIALATPLFTQAIIDKVIVHRTESTLVAIAFGMGVFLLFTAGLSWLRQYLVLHVGNRVDATLGSSVMAHLFKLPPLYFQLRPTGVIATRLQGVETIREFVAGAAVTLVLDLPFLLIFVGVMFWYSLALTLVVLALLLTVAVMSALVAPLFQSRLQEQFRRAARNQAFVTEYVAGMETVKSLQLEPQLNSRYRGYLADYLAAGFSTRQLANSYNTAANFLEQAMSLLVLTGGAWIVMHGSDFTIGMLVAFQMFSSRLAQPMLRLVGLWQQFQQARLAVDRLGDVMNAQPEPYSAQAARAAPAGGGISIEGLAFRYASHLQPVYENLTLRVSPGQTIAIVGDSGCGKSTLAKLLQGFYAPSAGRILLDGKDVRYLPVNECRRRFGVVPQETVLFSGSVFDNLQMASPDASFSQVVKACRMAEIHSVIESLPQGYQSELGERGAGLSGGQRQRIAIARALLKRPDILVFDEATSALDEATTEQFARTINALHGKVTMIFITHRLPRSLQVDAAYRLSRDGALEITQQGGAGHLGSGNGFPTLNLA